MRKATAIRKSVPEVPVPAYYTGIERMLAESEVVKASPECQMAKARLYQAIHADEAVEAELRKMESSKTADGLRKGVTLKDFQAVLDKGKKTQAAMFRAHDTFLRVRNHVLNPPKAGIPVDELKDIVSITFEAQDEGAIPVYTLPLGLIAHKIAEGVAKMVVEVSIDIPLCAEHRG